MFYVLYILLCLFCLPGQVSSFNFVNFYFLRKHFSFLLQHLIDLLRHEFFFVQFDGWYFQLRDQHGLSHTLIVEEMHCLWLKRLPLLYYLKQEFLYNCSLRLWRENKNDLAWRVWNPYSPYKSVGRMFHNKLLISCPNAHCKTFCLLFSSDSLVLIILPSLRQNDRCDLDIHCGLWDIFGIRIFHRWRNERLHSLDYNCEHGTPIPRSSTAVAWTMLHMKWFRGMSATCWSGSSKNVVRQFGHGISRIGRSRGALSRHSFTTPSKQSYTKWMPTRKGYWVI